MLQRLNSVLNRNRAIHSAIYLFRRWTEINYKDYKDRKVIQLPAGSGQDSYVSYLLRGTYSSMIEKLPRHFHEVLLDFDRERQKKLNLPLKATF